MNIKNKIDCSVSNSVSNSVEGRVWLFVMDSTRCSVWETVRDSVCNSVGVS